MKRLLLPMLLLVSCFTYAEKVTVHVEEAGTLLERIGENKTSSVSELTITGKINGTDVKLIREMPSLVALDLTDTKIVEGGDIYKFDYVTKNNEVSTFMFYQLSNLKSIKIPKSTTKIGYSAFSGCTRLSSITVYNGVEEIANNAFESCVLLTEFKMPSSVTKIGYQLFNGCQSLTTIRLSKNLTTIPMYAFKDCISLKSINIHEGVTHIENSAFSGCESLSNITIPNTLMKIESLAFSSCGMESITLPEGLRKIGDAAFAWSKITNIKIPDTVDDLGKTIFQLCKDLQSVTLGKKCDILQSNIFFFCTSLRSVYLRSDIPPIILTGDFDWFNKDECTLYVPKGSLSTYKSADGWKDFKNIVEMDFTGTGEMPSNRMYVVDGEIVVESNEMLPIEVYSISGELIKKTTETRVNVNPGIYVVKVGSKSQKMIVK